MSRTEQLTPSRAAPAPEPRAGEQGPAPLRIGLSACIFHADPDRKVFHGKPLLYALRSMAAWIGSRNEPELRALVYTIADPADLAATSATDFADDLDGLVLQGGVDVCPRSYGEEPRRPEWSGDAARDAYELGLVRAMVDREKPVLGICRGQQLLNVAFGGSLHQDILDEVDGARVHRDAEIYDRNTHAIAIEPGGWLASLYPGTRRAIVNSVHHQAVKRLGAGVRIEARSTDDGVVEAISIDAPGWVKGVQWHPEFADPTEGPALDNAAILVDFLRAARSRRQP